mmetsp:Transcript_50358/g.155678  ORF Transcript_50358/g.155678 Transcript_50358/m.155678 type:complete len:400 (+) Transcript_50358:1333-2532(+)
MDKRRADAVLVLLGLVLLRGEAPHRADVVDGLRGRAVCLAVGAVDRPVDLAAPLGVLSVAEGDGRHNGERQDGQPPGGVEGQGHAAHQQHEVGDEVVQQRVEGLHHLTCVVGEPRRDLARVHGVKEGDVHADHALEELLANAARELPQDQILREALESAEESLQPVHEEVHEHGPLESPPAGGRILQVVDDAVEDVALHAGRPDQHALRGDEADDGQGGGVAELERQADDPPEVGPGGELLAVAPHGPRAVALGRRVVLLAVAARAEVEVAGPAPVGDVVRALRCLVADVALVALEPELEEEGVHVKMRDELALLLGELGEVLQAHEVLHVDQEHDRGEESPLRPHEPRVVVEAHALQPVVHRHGGGHHVGNTHDDGLPRVRLLHVEGMVTLQFEDRVP